MNSRKPAPPPRQRLPTAAQLTESDRKRKQDERLDEELDQTFPASDPIPSHHDVHQIQ